MLQQINKAVESTNPKHKGLKTKTSQCYNSQINNVAIQFLTHVLINFQKNPKIAKNNKNSKKYVFLIYLHHF